jgi:predicted SAM-dependent methyltransferase
MTASLKNTFKKINRKPKGPTMLNIGCGTDYKDGWINIDNNSDNNIEKLDLNWDLRNPLPYKRNSVDFIFNEHFVEHLTVEEAQVIIKDLKTRAERINIAFREWGHKWLYDAEELRRRLKEAGCKNIKQCKHSKSTYPELRNLEIRDESTLVMEVTK